MSNRVRFFLDRKLLVIHIRCKVALLRRDTTDRLYPSAKDYCYHEFAHLSMTEVCRSKSIQAFSIVKN